MNRYVRAINEIRTGVGRVCGHRLGRPEAFLVFGPGRKPAAGAGGIGEHAGGGGGLGGELAAAIWRPSDRRLFGAVARGLDLHVEQVRAPGAVPGAPHHGGTLSGDFLYTPAPRTIPTIQR